MKKTNIRTCTIVEVNDNPPKTLYMGKGVLRGHTDEWNTWEWRFGGISLDKHQRYHM
jgi:hypothetical protein